MNEIEFSIIMATHKIEDNTFNLDRVNVFKTPLLLTDSLTSIKNQTYSNWKIYLTADCYENDSEILDVIYNIIPNERIKYYNLEKPGERDNTSWTTKQRRYCAGAAALNNSLNMASNDNAKYIVRLDHDDVWTHDHLETLYNTYTEFPNLAFAFTRSRKIVSANNSNKKYLYQPQNEDVTYKLNNLNYSSNNVSHSTVSWRTDLLGDMRYRNIDEQFTTEPIRDGIGLPGDWDMFKRIRKKIEKNNYQFIYIPKLTSYYRNRKGEL